MTNDKQQLFDEEYVRLLRQTTGHNIDTDEFAKSINNLKKFTECQPALTDLDQIPTPVPVTGWDKFKVGAAKVWDNETTRVLIKAGGAFAGVGLVVYSTIRRDHVLSQQAYNQASHSFK